MNIAIAGAGIAGGYLARLFEQNGIDVDVYDPMDHATSCGYRSCGWGTPTGIGPYLDKIGLDLNDYLIGRMPWMNFDGLKATTPLCTIDKTRFLADLVKNNRVKRHTIGGDEFKNYDIVVDSTGIIRALLPPCRSDLTLPTLQNRVAVKSLGKELLEPGVYGNSVPCLGYLWIFPLGNDHYHIGVGGIGLTSHRSLLDRFFHDSSNRFSFTPLCSCEGSVRVASPYYSTPFYVRNPRNNQKPQLVVGVGESIGTVSPFTGEGIVFSLECAKILSDTWPDFERYTKCVLSRFSWMKKERETLDYLLKQRGSGCPRLRDRWRVYRNARRSGIGLPMLDVFKQIGTLSRWVAGQDQEI
jgi:flavin-dependent dehydrogenase